MKILVVYYSRSGNTAAVGEQIAKRLGADAEEIGESSGRGGALGYLRCGREAAMKKKPKINAMKKKASAYDLVIIGTPIWAFTMASPVRTFLSEYGPGCRSVAFFATHGGSGADRAFKEMREISGKAPVAELSVSEQQIKDSKSKEMVERFCLGLKAIGK